MLRSPKATLTRSKVSAGNGRFSASQSKVGSTRPSSSRRSRPLRSIASLMSVCTTMPVAADALGERAREVAGAAGDVEHAVARAAGRRPRRCRPSTPDAGPSDIRSFIRSYRVATESNTPRTRVAFSASSTGLEAEMGLGHRSGSVVVAAAAGVRGRHRSGRQTPGRVPANAPGPTRSSARRGRPRRPVSRASYCCHSSACCEPRW